jgi:hypothetical protein
MSSNRKKKIRVILILLFGFVTITYILISIFDRVFETAVNRELKALIRSDPHRVYDLTYDSIRIDINRGNISVTNLMVIPRKEILDSLFLLGGLNQYTAEISLGKLEMVNFRWIRFLWTGKIHVNTFRISDLMVRYFLNKNVPQMKHTSIGNDLLDQKFISAETRHIDLLNGSLDFFIVREDTAKVLSFDSLDIRFTEFYTDSALIKNPIGYRLRELDLSLRNLTNDLVKDYRLTCGEISFNSSENKFSIKKIRMDPSAEKVESKNWLKLGVTTLEAAGINYDSLLYSGSVIWTMLLLLNLISPMSDRLNAFRKTPSGFFPESPSAIFPYP